jgi:3-methylcrotonyl-CoA carboxylase alpha subunit
VRLLIANRGEIAVRLIRACRELGVQAVAVYSEADAGALHVRLADAAVPIGPAAPAESYLNIPRLLDAARQTGADTVHPGYGFLSENAEFADAVREAGLVFVGPPAEAMRQMGGKIEARRLMRAAGVPVVPGFEGQDGWAAAAEQMGYPALVKAAGGGGGRGMRVVAGRGDLEAALESARREAEAAFGDGRVFIEKYIARGRHIEFQVFGDAHGNVVHLFERECSVQRRHQKLIEESPSPLLSQHPALRERMAAAAVRAAGAVGYENAGTVEFIVDPDTLEFYFLEMNTRLQVEHPVTEAVTGLDLVHLQLRVAAGEALPFTQADITQRGHALECRVYAEDPARGFLPSVGPLLKVVEPRGPGVRVDSGFESGDAVSQHYDALLAKIITHGATRAEALRRMRAALAGYHVLGIVTNAAFLRALLAHPVFEAGEATTRFVDEHFAEWRPAQALPVEALAAAALAEHLGRGAANGRAPGEGSNYDPWGEGDGFRIGASPSPLSPPTPLRFGDHGLPQGEGDKQRAWAGRELS